MRDERVLGSQVANAINIHQETLHLTLQPVMMPILLLRKIHQKLSIIENMRTLLRPLSNGAGSGFSVGTVRHTQVASQRISRGCSIWYMNPFNRLREALEFCILKVEWLLCWLRVDGFNGHINIRQKNNMVAR